MGYTQLVFRLFVESTVFIEQTFFQKEKKNLCENSNINTVRDFECSEMSIYFCAFLVPAMC